MRILRLGFLLSVLHTLGAAQVSTFLSATTGYQSNPLFNYQKIGDQVRQTYLELGFRSDALRLKYINGLVMFNRFTERTYLDHSLSASWSFAPPQAVDALADGSADEEQGDEEGEETGEPDSGEEQLEESEDTLDSLSSVETVSNEIPEQPGGERPFPLVADAGLKFQARHDRRPFREFDNASVEFNGQIQNDLWGSLRHISALAVNYRAYPRTKELTNISVILRTEFSLGTEDGLSAGVRLRPGLKYFTTAAFDTSRFEATRTYNVVTKPGAGKGGAMIIIKTPSQKDILANADVRTSPQLCGGPFVRFSWTDGSADLEGLFRYNPPPTARLLARTSGTSTINEDLYSDFFSHEGPEVNLILRQTLPLRIQAIISLGYERKVFGTPALDLDGEVRAGVRTDRRSSAELYLSRYFDIAGDLGCDLALSASALQNFSNDSYNDFSGWTVGCSLGFGI